ncbi:tetratricopeptide repeat protein, partial [Pseudomonas syringae]
SEPAQMAKDRRTIASSETGTALALNALCCTLSDRTTRYSGARELIEKAHQFSPCDPAVLASLGWVNYRLGYLEDAERYLRQALERLPDHEVAAHLGEVLWAMGTQRAAKKVWAKALEQQPDSTVLRSTLRRLTGSETL